MSTWTADLPNLPEIDDFASRVESDDNVKGVLLTGSHAHGMATDSCDVDLHVILGERDESWRHATNGGLDLRVVEVERLRRVPADPSNWWDRYRIGRGRLLLDRSEGVLDEHLAKWRTLSHAEQADAIDYYLEPYLTYSLRAMREFDGGETFAAHLDAVEALPWGLRLVFALQKRVRPTNRYLDWELRNHPLEQPPMPAERLMTLVTDILDRGSVHSQQMLFAFLEPQLRAAGFGGAMDTFPREISRLRG